MTMDKDTRKALIQRYLEADTTPAEEKRLREWFVTHPADADERDFARLIGFAAPDGLVETDDAEAEFDRIVAEGEKKRRKIVRWAASVTALAAAIALLLWLVPVRPDSSEAPLTPVQIAEGIQQMMLLDIGDIESITATPVSTYAILTAYLKDGSTCSYILSCNEDDGTTSLLACTHQLFPTK